MRRDLLLDLIRFWPQPLLGLDIQAEEIRLIQLHFLKRKSIKQAVSRELPPGAVIDGKIEEPATVSECLQELIQDHKLQNFKVAIALPKHCVVSQQISVAKGLSESELEEEIIGHLKHSMSNPKEDLFYDYVVTAAKDETQDNVFLIAAYFFHFNAHMLAVQNAGLIVQVVDVDQYALTRASRIIKKNNIFLEDKWLISLGLALHGRI